MKKFTSIYSLRFHWPLIALTFAIARRKQGLQAQSIKVSWIKQIALKMKRLEVQLDRN